LQPYPADDDVELMSADADSYRHAQRRFDEMQAQREHDSAADGRRCRQLKLVSWLCVCVEVLPSVVLYKRALYVNKCYSQPILDY